MDDSRAPEPHRAFLARAMPVLQADPRFYGVAAAGSWLSEMDEFSDLDLILAVAPSAVTDVSASRQAIAASLGTLLAAFTGEHVGEPRLLICLYDAPLLHVDLKFVALEDVADRVEDPVVLWERDAALTRALSARSAVASRPDAQWIEDRFWVWIHYAASKLGRGELFEVIDCLAFLRSQVLAPLAAAATEQAPRGVRRLERKLPGYAPAFERTLGRLEPESLADALFGAVRLYRELRELGANAGVERRSEAEAASVRYLESIASRGA